MNTPEEFTVFTNMFHQNSDIGDGSWESWIDPKIKMLKPQSREIIRRFLTRILRDHCDESEIRAAWLSGAADFGVNDGEWAAFFTVLQDRFEKVV